MAEIKAFAALRYDISKAGSIEELVCPAYTVPSSAEHCAMLAKSACGMVILEHPEGGDPSAAAKALDEFIVKGILRRDMDAGIYICEDIFTDENGEMQCCRSLLCRVKLEESETEVILSQQNDTAAAEERFHLINSTGCNFSPVTALYEDRNSVTRKRLDSLAKTCAPRYNFTLAGITHRLWVINDPVAVNAVREDFTDRKLSIKYGADAYAAALKYRDSVRSMGKLLSDSEYVLMQLADSETSSAIPKPLSGLAIYEFD